MEKTLIVTLLLNEEADEYFTNLRNQHFPAAINYLRAHLTLFHKLPDEDYVYETIENLSCKQARFLMEVAAVRSIGNGVAFKMESPTLMALHASLQSEFKLLLIPQDQQRLWPHITIQNKVPPAQANALALTMNESFKPFYVTAEGFAVWAYLDGPWSLRQKYLFPPQTPKNRRPA
jgi:2'-5' RNA ligase